MQQSLFGPDEGDGRNRKWFNSSVKEYRGNLSEVSKVIPRFERRTFAISQPDEPCSYINHKLDTIVRQPLNGDGGRIPVGVVSKDYLLIQHQEVIEAAILALEKAKIKPDNVNTVLLLTEYGERMELSIFLPVKYAFDPGDGHELALRLELVNSVDGSTRFRALVGWFRFVCSNGLVVGVTQMDLRRRHLKGLRIEDVGYVLEAGIESSKREKRSLLAWQKASIHPGAVSAWVDNDIKQAWGFKAATRVINIARTGYDCEIDGAYMDEVPSTIQVRNVQYVRGAPPEARNLYDICQILAWLAKERRDIQEQLEWREQIPSLIKSLKKRSQSIQKKRTVSV